MLLVTILILIDGFLQSKREELSDRMKESHNPYFNRWFSAIYLKDNKEVIVTKVTILILIDGFLQLITGLVKIVPNGSHNPYFNRWFSAIHRSPPR